MLLTTHYMFEADELCDRIAVIRSGTIVAEGTPAQLKDAVSAGHVLEVEAYGVRPDVLATVRGAGRRAVRRPSRRAARRSGCSCRWTRASRSRPQVLALLDGTTVGRVVTRQPSLEDAYVELVGTSANGQD